MAIPIYDDEYSSVEKSIIYGLDDSIDVQFEVLKSESVAQLDGLYSLSSLRAIVAVLEKLNSTERVS